MNQSRKTVSHPLESDDTPLAFRFSAVAKRYYGAASKQLEALDFDKYYFVLSLISRMKQTTQQGLADCLDIDKATIVRIIDYLTEKGLVKREPHAEDRRCYLIVPTAKANKALPVIGNTFAELNNKAFEGFTSTEKKQFLNMLSRMQTNLSALPVEPYELHYVKKTS